VRSVLPNQVVGVVGNIVSEWTQILGLVLLTKRLTEVGSKEGAKQARSSANNEKGCLPAGNLRAFSDHTVTTLSGDIPPYGALI
jgi:hypothetical protein